MTGDRIFAAIAEKLQITRPLVCLDVETTGKAFGVDRIVPLKEGTGTAARMENDRRGGR